MRNRTFLLAPGEHVLPASDLRRSVATLTRTYTKTYALMDAWASTIPWDCVKPGHSHTPMVGDLCAVDDCQEPLCANEECYAVTQLGRLTDGREQWVCWRHVRPDAGPITT